jgi:hypothetical protein
MEMIDDILVLHVYECGGKVVVAAHFCNCNEPDLSSRPNNK